VQEERHAELGDAGEDEEGAIVDERTLIAS